MRKIFIALIMLISFPVFANVELGEQSHFEDHQYSQPVDIGEVIGITTNDPFVRNNATGESTQQITYQESTANVDYIPDKVASLTDKHDKQIVNLPYEVGWCSS